MTASIEAKCGPYPAGETTTATTGFDSFLTGLGLTPISSSSGKTERGAAVGAGIGAAAGQLLPALAAILGPQDTTAYDPEAGEMDVGGGSSAGVPWGPIIILGGLAVVLFGGSMYLATRDDEE